MNKPASSKKGILIKTAFIILFFPVCSFCQLGSSRMPKIDLGSLMAEALQQAIGLEKLPDANSLLNEDSIFIVVYGINDSLPNVGLAGFLPTHIDIWKIKSISVNNITHKDSSFYYLKMFLKQDDNKFIIDFICQPNYEDYIDRGRLTLEFKSKNGVFTLISLSRWYG